MKILLQGKILIQYLQNHQNNSSCVYSRRQASQQIELNTSQADQKFEPEIEPKSESNSPVDVQGETCEETGDNLDKPITLRKGVRSCTTHPISNFVSYHRLSTSFQAFVTHLSFEETVPKNKHEALKNLKWRVILEEMKALQKNNTWKIIDLPGGKRSVARKWVFTVKYNPDRKVERHKARLVAKEFTQTVEINYSKTFVPIAKLNSIRILLSLAANFDWPLYQLHIKNAFLNGELVEEVHMELPLGFFDDQGNNKVCKLNESLYGLKQSTRAWFGRFSQVLR